MLWFLTVNFSGSIQGVPVKNSFGRSIYIDKTELAGTFVKSHNLYSASVFRPELSMLIICFDLHYLVISFIVANFFSFGSYSHMQTECATLLTPMIILAVFVICEVYCMISPAMTNSADFKEGNNEYYTYTDPVMCCSLSPLGFHIICSFSIYTDEGNGQLIPSSLYAVRIQ